MVALTYAVVMTLQFAHRWFFGVWIQQNRAGKGGAKQQNHVCNATPKQQSRLKSLSSTLSQLFSCPLPWPPALFLRVVSPPPSSHPPSAKLQCVIFPNEFRNRACLEPRYYFCPVRAGS